MNSRNFHRMLEAKWAEGKFVCVGLDPVANKIPECVREQAEKDGLPGHSSTPQAFVNFCIAIVEATKDLVCAFKPNGAFFDALGPHDGQSALHEVIGRTHEIAPDVPVILDIKRGDIGSTNTGYVTSTFDLLHADAITVHPFLGQEALQPFLDRKDKGIIVLCRTSNPGAGEFQDLRVGIDRTELEYIQNVGPVIHSVGIGGIYTNMSNHVAYQVTTHWNVNGNCALVVGATYPSELEHTRRICGTLPILIPGIGAQGGDVEKTIKAGKDSRGMGMIVNSSRGIIYASAGEDFAEAARRETTRLSEEINKYR